MSKIILFVLVFLFSTVAIAEEKRKIPPGMEILKIIPGLEAIVPKGTKIHQGKSLLTFETTAAYMSRRFVDIEKRFEKIEEKEEKLSVQIEELKKILSVQLKAILDQIDTLGSPSEEIKK